MRAFVDIRACLRLLPPRLRWRWFALLPIALCAAVLEAAGAAGAFALLSVLNAPSAEQSWPQLIRWIPALGRGDSRDTATALTIGLLVFYAGRFLILALAAYLHERTLQSSIVLVVDRLVRGYFTMPYSLYFERHTAAMVSRAKDLVEASYTMVLSPAVRLIADGLITLGLLAMVTTLTPAGAALVPAALAALVVVPAALSGRLFERWGSDAKRLDLAIRQDLQQGLSAIKDILVSGRADFFADRIVTLRRQLSRVQLRRSVSTEILRQGVETALVGAFLVVLLLLLAARRPLADLMSLVGLFAYVSLRLLPLANRASGTLNAIRAGGPFVRDVVAEIETVEARRATVPAREPADTPAFCDSVVFDRVSYEYAADLPVLRDVSFTIRHGESIGVVGRTGAGKSTLVDLLLGLIAPTTGEIRVDGRALEGSLPWWQRQVGYVPQAAQVIDDSLRRNIAFGLRDDQIDEAGVRAAIRVAGLEDTIGALPDGLDTRVGERGIRLSAGERQRVAIARAVYRRPRVFVFDEATSSLDYQTERAIGAAIEALRGGTTVVVIAHRVHTVRNCDRILLFAAGSLQSVGSFDDLSDGDEAFRELSTSQ